MSKIKEILEKMKASPREYHDLSLLIAKRVWLFIASLYYLVFLFTVGGFYFGPVTLDQLAMISFHLYSVLVVASAWFFYSLCEYGVHIYIPTHRWPLVIAMLFSMITASVALLAHIGIL